MASVEWDSYQPLSKRPAHGNTTCSTAGMPDIDLLDALQWPAMAVTLLAAWLVASSSEHRRGWGFWVFLLSNALWIAWGLSTHAYALVALQIGLGFMNIRGAKKNKVE